jgi:acyl-CoA synthetase (AMP-forming)/AMP-acid ligase II
MAFNIADMFEYAVDAVPDKVALVQDDRQLTYRELEARVNGLAHHLAGAGIGAGDHVGIYGPNSIEWVEAMLAAAKLRAVPVNINYRYVEEELRYLFDNADLRAVVYQREYGPRIAAVRADCPTLEHLIVIDDGSEADLAGLDAVPYDEAVARGDAGRDFEARTADDIWIIYTGGTTGMPKGVMWRQEDIFFALAGGTDPFTRQKVAHDHVHAESAAANPGQLVFLVAPPLMHGAAQVATMMNLMQGNRLVILAKFDGQAVWGLVAREGIHSILITGDAMGRPLIEALEELDAAGEELDLSSLLSVSSSAAVFSPTVKERFLERFPNLVITDSIGSTEGGFNGLVTVGKGNTAMKGGGPTVARGPATLVLDDDLKPVEAGSGVVGKVARSGNIALGYYKDPEKTAATFVIAADGERYAIPGDFATVEADGSITLLGRGSVSINSGGEKIYPEEVEQALKAHADVFDALVVGVADERWGQRVAAVVQPRPGREPTLEALDAHCRSYVAGYKVPRQLTLVDEIVRSPAGKPDYPWAKRVAEAGGGGGRGDTVTA